MSKEQTLVEAAKNYEKAVEALNAAREQLNAAAADLGIDKYAQDPETRAVYKVIKPTGTFTYYRDIDYKRTAMEGEKGGVVLSKKEAQEAGFIL